MTGKSDLYFWDPVKEQIIEVLLAKTDWGMVSNGFMNFECVDTRYGNDAPHQRYGHFFAEGSMFNWAAKPFEEFDPVFRTQLLLLGVS